jgi:hypothetical protein
MKKVILILSSILVISNAGAQMSLEFQGKGSMASTWLFNKNISDLGQEQDYAMAWGSSYGVAANLYFNNIGIGVEGLFGKHNGGYAGTISNIKYNSEVTLKGYQIPVLLKLKSDGGAYVELGVQANGISNATFTGEGEGIPTVSKDVTSNYSKNYMSAVLGFGANVKPSKSLPLGILFGIRLNYGFGDAKGVDALSSKLDDKARYPTYEKTNAASGSIVLGLTYSLEVKK